MNKALELVFRNASGKETVISIASPKDNITLAEVTPVMQSVIDKNIFITKGGALTQIVEARIRSRETTKLA